MLPRFKVGDLVTWRHCYPEGSMIGVVTKVNESTNINFEDKDIVETRAFTRFSSGPSYPRIAYSDHLSKWPTRKISKEQMARMSTEDMLFILQAMKREADENRSTY